MLEIEGIWACRSAYRLIFLVFIGCLLDRFTARLEDCLIKIIRSSLFFGILYIFLYYLLVQCAKRVLLTD